MTMSISPENQRLLTEMVTSGHFKSQEEALAEALRLLKDDTSRDNGTVLTPDQWREKFKKHLDSTPSSRAVKIDDSRESIYEGQGE